MIKEANKGEKESIRTEWGERIHEVIFETGLTVRAFANLVGYKHPSTFYATIKKRKISPKLMSKIIEGYRKELHKELNPKWLDKGIQPKLLTIKNESLAVQTLEEHTDLYQTVCKKCLEKDKKIKELEDERDNLKNDIIKLLKEASELKKAISG